MGPVKWSHFYLYGIFDIGRRRVVALRNLHANPVRVTTWRVDQAESAIHSTPNIIVIRLLAISPLGGYVFPMAELHTHLTHPDIVNRLKRANGHLLSVIAMVEGNRPCVEIAQQLHAVEKAIAQAKRTLIQDHIDHCLDEVVGKPEVDSSVTSDFKAIIKYL
jgi:DNA-binding FrmR family transcriptional regulator